MELIAIKQITISEHEYNNLKTIRDDYYLARKKFLKLDKNHQELIKKITRYEEALELLTWKLGSVSTESMRMRQIAKKALYDE